MRVEKPGAPGATTALPDNSARARMRPPGENHLPASFRTGTKGLQAGITSEIDVIRRLVPGADEADLNWLTHLLANPDLAAVGCGWARGTRARNRMPLTLATVNGCAPTTGNT